MRTMLINVLLSASCLAQTGNLPGDSKPPFRNPVDADTPQISVTVKFLTGPPEIFADVKARDLIRTPPQQPNRALPVTSNEQLAQHGGIRLISASTVIETREPVFIRKLTTAQCESIQQSAQKNVRANLLFAPKVTLFDGQEAAVNDLTERPFVVGLTKKEDGYAPQIETFRDGTQIAMRTWVSGEDVRMDLSIQLSNVEDVNTAMAGHPGTKVQVPTVRSTEIDLSALVKPGESLAVCGFHTIMKVQRKTSFLNGKVPFVSRMFTKTATAREPQEMLILITPSILDLSDGTD